MRSKNYYRHLKMEVEPLHQINEMYNEALKKLEAVKEETKKKSLARGLFDAVAGISSSTKAKNSISHEIDKFIKKEKLMWKIQDEIGKRQKCSDTSTNNRFK